MFVETNGLVQGLGKETAVEKRTKKSNGGLSLSEQTISVLNTIIGQRGHMAITVARGGPDYTATTSSNFTKETAFECGSGKLVLEVSGARYYPRDTMKFVQWIEDGFRAINSLKQLDQPPKDMRFTRIN